MALEKVGGPKGSKFESSTPVKLEKGEMIIGYYMNKYTFESEYGPTEAVKVRQKSDNKLYSLIVNKGLSEDLDLVRPGTYIEITFLGKTKTSKGFYVKNFLMQQDKEDVIEVKENSEQNETSSAPIPRKTKSPTADKTVG